MILSLLSLRLPASLVTDFTNQRCARQVLSVVSSGQTLLRAPGAAVYYADNLHNLPPAFVKLLSTFPTVHNVSIFLTIRQVHPPLHRRRKQLLCDLTILSLASI